MSHQLEGSAIEAVVARHERRVAIGSGDAVVRSS